MPSLHDGLHVISIFPFWKSIAMTSFSLTIFSHFYFSKLFQLVRDRFRYTTHAQTLCKWAGACRNRPRTPESQHAWYDLMLGQSWLRWLGNESTINTAMTAACALMRGWWVSTFFIGESIFFIITWHWQHTNIYSYNIKKKKNRVLFCWWFWQSTIMCWYSTTDLS